MFLFWYCIDDHLAAWLNWPALGHMPVGIWLAIFALDFAAQIVGGVLRLISKSLD